MSCCCIKDFHILIQTYGSVSACEITLMKWNKVITTFSSAGFPNVTVAPDSSQGPIVLNQDPISQAILGDSVVEPQVICSAYSQMLMPKLSLSWCRYCGKHFKSLNANKYKAVVAGIVLNHIAPSMSIVFILNKIGLDNNS